jgi:hypothetical protein
MDEMDPRHVEQALVLHSYTRERDKQIDAHPELAGKEDDVDIESIKLSAAESRLHGRVISSPRAIAKRAVASVRAAAKKKTVAEHSDHPLSDDEYVAFFRSPLLKKHRD